MSFKDFAGFTIEKEDLLVICPYGNPDTLARLAPVFEELFLKFQIKKRAQVACFIAQLGHESAGFQYCKELGDNAYFTENYEGREDLGNTEPGDGAKFAGRGYLQVTGRANVTAFQEYLTTIGIKVDLISNPDLIADDPKLALLSAFWFFNSNNLWGLAANKDVETLSYKINGGSNGLEERIELSDRAFKVFGC